MSNISKGYLQAILFLGISHTLCAFLLAIPMYYYFLSPPTYEIIATGISCLFWCIAGYLLGNSIYQKAFLRALPIVIVYLFLAILLSIINQDFTVSSLGLQGLRMLLFLGSTRVFMKTK